MSHPADHPLAALAIMRGLTGQLQKAKQAGDMATVAAIEAVLARARKIARPIEQARSRAAQASSQPEPRPPEPQPVPPPRPPGLPPRPPTPRPPKPLPQMEEEDGWAEIVVDNRRRHWR